ncbi:hypothetical protein [Amycolatopsis sp. NPDC001319]|uniref:hypothetical protein n=1 Tax=unclassified Amycolatopsis TaxID=2618356 RepID=UPI00369A0127
MLDGEIVALDGEIVALDDDGRPNFRLLQNHDTSSRAVAYFVFDVLQLGDDVLPSPALAEQAGTMTARCGAALPHDGIELVAGDFGVSCSSCLVQALTPRAADPETGQRWREW